MNYGYYMGAAGVLTSMYRQDVAANNLANVETTGFKPDFTATIPRPSEKLEDTLLSIPSNRLIDRLGGGVLLAPNRTGFTQGGITVTKNAFDLAIEGRGFLTVSGGGSGTANVLRYTRDGRMTLDPSGRLITVNGGHTVLDDSGRPITLDPALPFVVASDGSVSQPGAGGGAIARLGFVDIPDTTNLRKVGENLFAPNNIAAQSSRRAAAPNPSVGRIIQFARENSAVDPIKAMMAVQDAANAVNTTVRVMQIHDELMNRAINTLGRVTA